MDITMTSNLAWFTQEAVIDAQDKHPDDKSAQVASVKRQLSRWEREYGTRQR